MQPNSLVDHAGNESDRSSSGRARARRRWATIKRHLSVPLARSRSRSNSRSPTFNEQAKQQAAVAANDVLARARSGHGGLLVNGSTVRTMSPLAVPARHSKDSTFWGESTDLHHNGLHNDNASSSSSDSDNDESSSDDEQSRQAYRQRNRSAVRRTQQQQAQQQQQQQKEPLLKRWWLIGSTGAAVVCAAVVWQLLPQQQQQRQQPPHQQQQQQQREVVWHYATQPPAATLPQQQQQRQAASAADINAGLFNSMFDSVDENHDGAIKRQEMRDFVSARGSSSAASRLSDGLSDIEAGVTSTMHNIDINDDDNLTKADLLAYWGRLGSLLTVDEVADWVLHAVQLPLEVAETFRAHSVTGYDFIDLMDNGGALLEQELGISKAAFRKRLVQRMEWKMWAMGTEPAPPTTVKWAARTGGGLVVTWLPPQQDKRSFPVHKYLLKRRLLHSNATALPVFGDVSSSTCSANSGTTAAGALAVSSSSSTDTALWVTVLDGPGTTCVDGRLQSDSAYLYSLQAWNALGHSEAVTFEYVTDSEPVTSSSNNSYFHQYYNGRGSSSGNVWRWELMAYTAATVIAGFLVYIVLKAQDSSSSSSNPNSSNSSRKQAASGGYDSPPQQQQQYEQQQQCSDVYASPATTPGRRLLHLSASPSDQCRTLPPVQNSTSQQLHEQELSAVRQRFRSSSLSPTRDSIAGDTSKGNPRLPPMRSYSGDSTTVKHAANSSSSTGNGSSCVVSSSIMRRVAARRAHSQQDWPTSSTGNSVPATSILASKSSVLSRSDGAMNERLHAGNSYSVVYHGNGSDDSSGCYICGGYAKWYSTRHTCRMCHRPFCHKHGRTSHTLPVCPVGSNCVCQVCISERNPH
jgi:hypothetical protein